MSKHIPLAYRREIDGMRTLAILPVILYHLKIPMGDGVVFSGGFLGVDLFFVLSGFLITQILLGEQERTGRISLGRFYHRRARRILPALIMVILASCVAAWAVLEPSALIRFANSIVGALGFFSNFFWYFKLGEYGAADGLIQPLLHTWSLSIEEQFYLFFPLLLMIVPRGRPQLLVLILIALTLGSLIAAQVTTAWNRDFSFFSPISRAWELLAGSLLAVAVRAYPDRPSPLPASVTRLLPSLALLVLLASMVLIDLPQVAHPGLVTVPTVLATMVLLWFTRPGEPVTILLSTAPLVYIGQLSYSLYLWHFPIFAFGRLTAIDLPGPLQWSAWVALTFACSIVGYHLVERRFRFDVSNRILVGSLAGTLIVILGFIGLVRGTDLLERDRSAIMATYYGDNEYDNSVLTRASWSILDKLAGDEKIRGNISAHGPSQDELTRAWFTDPDTLNVLIVGNSHAKDMFNALYLNSEAFPGLAFARFGLGKTFPEEQRIALYETPNFDKADVILIASRYSDDFDTKLPVFIAELQARGKAVVIAGATAEFVSPGTKPIADWFILKHGGVPQPDVLNARAFLAEDTSRKSITQVLADIAETTGATLLSRRTLLCSDQAQSCTVLTPDQRKAMYDDHHWSLDGARYFGAQAAAQGWAEIFRESSTQR